MKEFLEKTFKTFYEMNHEEHSEAFLAIKRMTHERLMKDKDAFIINAEDNMKGANQIHEFIVKEFSDKEKEAAQEVYARLNTNSQL